MTHAAYFLAAILGLTWFVAAGLSVLWLDPTPFHIWLAGFVVWLVLIFRGEKK